MAKSALSAALLFSTMISIGCGGVPAVQAASTSKQQLEAGGTINLPAGMIEISCADQAVITKSTKIIGAGFNETILRDSCSTGDTITADLTNPITVSISDVQISHVTANGSALRAIGGIQVPPPPTPIAAYMPLSARTLTLTSVELNSAANCLVTEGNWLLFIYRSRIRNCSNDGAQLASFGVTLHDNWFQENGHNGVTFLGSGFCASCIGNEYIGNKVHGLEYRCTGICDAFHNNEYVDSNGDVGLVTSGIRQLTYNNGWIGTNTGGGAIIGDGASLGIRIVGTTFANNFGNALTVTQTAGPLRIQGNSSSLQHSACDASINGVCANLNQ